MANLDEVMAFVAAVDAGSFAAGGRARGLTRSAIGKAITRLESRLGSRLIHRTTRSLSLTEEGRGFYERCSQILADLEEAEAGVGENSMTPRGLLKLTVPDAFGRRCVLPALQAFLKAWPAVEVDVSFTDRVVDIVEEGFDLAIRVGGAEVDANLISRVIARHRSVLCASPSYINERGEPKQLDDLINHDCLVFGSQARRQTWRFRSDDEWVEMNGRSRMRLDSGEAICNAAVAGMGIAYLPHFLVDAEIAQGDLVPLLKSRETEIVPICAIYSSRRHLSPRIRAFIDLLVNRWSNDLA
ncbi:LysR family transcriptional regulator [Paraburkholderia sediminicola]|uniref:LysR family transcriptional regulator n=1 Tax=Paraburkholderia sediminicola TaxID=458836 RepID=UPI0038B95981